MTNEQIQEAAKLIREVEQLESIELQETDYFVLAREPRSASEDYRGCRYVGVADLGSVDAVREIMTHLIQNKKARLNDIRGAC